MHRALFPCVLIGFLSTLVYSADKKDREDIAVDKHEKVLAEARKRVDEAKRKAAQAKGAAERAEDEARKQRAEHDKVRQSVLEHHDSNPQLVKARQEVDLTEAELESLTAPILRRLAAEPDYASLVQNREKIRQQMQLAQPADRERLAKLALTANQAVSQAENAAFDSDQSVVAAKTKLAALRAKLRPLAEERDRKVAGDPRIQRSSQEIAGSKRQADQARDALEKALRDLANAIKHLDSEEAEHRRLVQAERRDDTSDRQAAKKNNKKK